MLSVFFPAAPPTVVTTFADESGLGRGPPVGLIVGVAIGAAMVSGIVAVALILFLPRGRDGPVQNNEDRSSATTSDTAETATDEALITGYQPTLDTAASGIDTVADDYRISRDQSMVGIPLV
jgi:hypothetical protein